MSPRGAPAAASAGAGPEPSRAAVVGLGPHRWRLPPGGRLAFGRGEGLDVRVGDDPVDTVVSRRAGVLEALDDQVLVRNTSTKRPLRVSGPPGGPAELPPGGVTATGPALRCTVTVHGRHGSRYRIGIDLRPLLARGDLHPPAAATGGGEDTTSGYRRLPDLGGAERRYLTALCEPWLAGTGGPGTALPAYAGIARRCGVSPRTVRHALDALRTRLALEEGLPGLVAGDLTGPPPREGFLGALAAWAVGSGNVTAADLVLLPRPVTP